MNDAVRGPSAEDVFHRCRRKRQKRRIERETSKRQQCVRATELAKRTGLKIRYAGLFDPITEKKNSGKDFDASGRTDVSGGECNRKTRHFERRNAHTCMEHKGQRRFHITERREK